MMEMGAVKWHVILHMYGKAYFGTRKFTDKSLKCLCQSLCEPAVHNFFLFALFFST